MICSECHKKIRDRQYFNIDGNPVCYKCIFGDTEPILIYPSRTLRRTSRIGITNVRLLSISGLDLYVEGLDAFQDSPVIPYDVGSRSLKAL